MPAASVEKQGFQDSRTVASHASRKRERPAACAGRPARHTRGRGFTLTELLVVITIIAVLAGLITVAVLGALDTAKQTRIKAEVDLLDASLRQFKDKYGAYPPYKLNSNSQQFRAFIARAFPRYYNISNAWDDLSKFVDTTDERPDQALVFWLSGFNPDPTTPFELRDDPAMGYSLTNMLPKARRKDVMFDFDPTRLQKVGRQPASGSLANSYIQPGSKKNIPYVYFDFSAFPGAVTPANYQWEFYRAVGDPTYTAAGYVHPYGDALDAALWFQNKDSFQIIAAGLDDIFGDMPATATVGHYYPTGSGYDVLGTEEDNVTNFCGKPRLGDAKP